ncbi:MAG: CHAT domain-containing protein [Verrucomicrobiales bacterium]|nr:CHAT domain-containing protein [Verrucomicrobiales bacterium]
MKSEPDWARAHLLAKVSSWCYEAEEEKVKENALIHGFPEMEIFQSGSTRGVIIANDEVLIVGFRGSKSLQNWLCNLDFKTVDLRYFKMHSGFYRSFESVRLLVWELMWLHGCKRKKVFLTGHSLGGALAMIAAMQFSEKAEIFTGIYTFGQPAVGDENFVRHFELRYENKFFRIVNRGDFIPRLPPAGSEGYIHAGRTIHPQKSRGEGTEEEGFLSPEKFSELKEEITSKEQTRGQFLYQPHSLHEYLKRIATNLPEITRDSTRSRDPASVMAYQFTLKADSIHSASGEEAVEATEGGGKKSRRPVMEEDSVWIPPFAVHVLWSPKRKDDLCRLTAEKLFEFLSPKPSNSLDLESGTGIPVFAGFHFEHIKQIANEAQDNNPGTLNVVALLLEIEGKQDSAFKGFWEEYSSKLESSSRVLFLPVLLDNAWQSIQNDGTKAPCRSAQRIQNHGAKAQAAVWDISVAVSEFLTSQITGKEGDKQTKVFVSHTKADLTRTANLAIDVHDYLVRSQINPFFDTFDIAAGHSLDDQLAKNQKNALCLSLRTDSYAESPFCQNEILMAKKFRVPIVTVNAITDREHRSMTYGGNTLTLACDPSKRSENLEKILQHCLQGWLRHCYFQLFAPTLPKSREFPETPIALARPPELLDFSQGWLPSSSGTLVIYPDPPIMANEYNLIRNAFPKVRIATPTTLFKDNLRGFERLSDQLFRHNRVALSLSDSPDLAGSFAEITEKLSGSKDSGILCHHLDRVIAYLTLILIRGGAELGYGGHFDAGGYTTMLSNLASGHKRRERSKRSILHSYVAGFIWERKPASAETIDAEFYPINLKSDEVADTPAKMAAELSLMRRIMADEKYVKMAGNAPGENFKSCDIRVIMGGKSKPKTEIFRKGYLGRYPGQAEEALYHLRAGKPLYVAGGFYGAAQQVAYALYGGERLEELIKESNKQESGESDFSKVVKEYPDYIPEGLDPPENLEKLWKEISSYGKVMFQNRRDDGTHPWPYNGLSAEENLQLFRSIEPDEICSLILKGMAEVARKDRTQNFQLSLFNGAISDMTDIDAYGVLYMTGAALRGADGALDDTMNGALSDYLKSELRNGAVPVSNDSLSGDWVIMHELGDIRDVTKQDSPETQKRKLIDSIKEGMRLILESCEKGGLYSVGLVPYGVTLGVDIRESILAMLEGISEAAGEMGDTPTLENIVICEASEKRYEQLRTFLIESKPNPADKKNAKLRERLNEVQKQFTVDEKTPNIPAQPRPQSVYINLLDISRSEPQSDLEVTLVTGQQAASGIERLCVDWDRHEIDFRYFHRNWDSQISMSEKLLTTIFSENAASLFKECKDNPVEVMHDFSCSRIPFELLSLHGGGESLRADVRRTILIDDWVMKRRYRRTSIGMKMLLIANPQSNDSKNRLPGAAKEAKAIQEALEDRREISITSLIGSEEATLEKVCELLNEEIWDFVHFAGHGGYENNSAFLVLSEGKRLTAEDLGALKKLAPPALVFLNACEAGKLGSDVAEEEDQPDQYTQTSADFAGAILRSGVCGFIGNQRKVGDHAAATFAKTLYQNLCTGSTLGDSIHISRKTLFSQKNGEWANFVFYGSPEIRL